MSCREAGGHGSGCGRLCVVAGAHEEVDKLEEQLVERGVGCLRLRTSHAFHSSMMEPILEQFRRVVDSVSLQPPTAPYVSTLTGDWITEDQATSTEYWVRHLREPVQFGQGLSVLLKDPSFDANMRESSRVSAACGAPGGSAS